MIKALATCLTVIALAGCTVPIERTASGDVPASRVYIKSMTQQGAGLSQVEFSRAPGMLNSDMLELAINDVVLAQIAGGEHLAIWLKPGSYEFGVKPVHSLSNTENAPRAKTTVEVKSGTGVKVGIASDLRGIKLSVNGQ